MRSGELAARAGITVRTLRYYDQIGLLKPSMRSESGQRVYSDVDADRLEQILTLKRIGLSLDEIRSLLDGNRTVIQTLLVRQKSALEQQIHRLQQMMDTIDQAQTALSAAQEVDLKQLVYTLREVAKMTQANTIATWLNQWMTPEQQAETGKMMQSLPLAEQRRRGEALKALFEELLARDTGEPVTEQQIAEWENLTQQIAGGDPVLAERIRQAYAHRGTLASSDQAVQDWLHDLGEAAAQVEAARQGRQ